MADGVMLVIVCIRSSHRHQFYELAFVRRPPRQNHLTMQTIFSGLCLAAFASAAASSKIRWGPCPKGEFTTTVAVQCGTLRVPLDYTQPNSRKTLDLEIVKIPAAVQPSRGSIQLNFGGPGVPTRQDAPKMRTSGPVCVIRRRTVVPSRRGRRLSTTPSRTT